MSSCAPDAGASGGAAVPALAVHHHAGAPARWQRRVCRRQAAGALAQPVAAAAHPACCRCARMPSGSQSTLARTHGLGLAQQHLLKSRSRRCHAGNHVSCKVTESPPILPVSITHLSLQGRGSMHTAPACSCSGWTSRPACSCCPTRCRTSWPAAASRRAPHAPAVWRCTCLLGRF